MNYIGIDPGASGGIAIVDDQGLVLVAIKMPETDRDLLDMLEEGFTAGLVEGQQQRPSRAVLEHVWSSPQMGVASAFKFGVGVGMLRMALTAARIPFDQVTPGKWQKAMGALAPVGQRGKPGKPGTKDKNITKRRAQQLFPGVKVTHATADALLLAEYCRRVACGLLPQESPLPRPGRALRTRRPAPHDVDDSLFWPLEPPS